MSEEPEKIIRMNTDIWSRRNFLSTLGFGLSGLVFPHISCGGGHSGRKPNILFLFADDQRFNTINVLGNREIITPNLDALARSGTVFSNAYIMGGQSAAVCMPSRAMLWTGRTLFNLERMGAVIPENHTMLGEAMRQAGYNTFATGKWHNGPAAYNRCFGAGDEILFGGMGDHFKTYLNHYHADGNYPDAKKVFWPKAVSGLPDTEVNLIYDHVSEGVHSSEVFRRAAVDYLEQYKNNTPFLMYVSFMAPHDPRNMPKEYLNMYDPGGISLPENFLPEHPFDNGELKIRDEVLEEWPRTPEAVRRHIAAYYAMITHLDVQIGNILDALKRAGQYENTIIVFSGDNGLALGQHGLMGKQNVYEHSVHVPLIFSGPGIPAGERRDAFCYLYDIYPTLCELSGLPVPESVQGMSLVPAIENSGYKTRESMFYAYKNYQRAVRTDRWKMILYNVKGRKTTQLFDLVNDPWETKNLADNPEYADYIRELTVVMKDWIKRAGDSVDLDKPDWGVDVIP